MSPVLSKRVPCAHLANLLLLLGSQLKVKNVEALGHALRLGAGRDGQHVALVRPAQHDLRGRLAVLLGQPVQHRRQRRLRLARGVGRRGRFLGPRARRNDGAQRRVGRHQNALALGVLVDAGGLVLQVGAEFDLVHGGHDAAAGLLEALQVLDPEVGHANALGQAGLLEVDEGLPCVLEGDAVLLDGHERAVDEVQVDVVRAQFLEAVFEGLLGVADVGQDLGCDVELVAGDAGGLDGAGDLGLGAVGLGGVDVGDAGLEGRLEGIHGGGVGRVQVVALLAPLGSDAVPHGGDLVSVVEREGWDGHCTMCFAFN